MARRFLARIIAASRPARPWLTVSASSALGRLIIALRREHTHTETTTAKPNPNTDLLGVGTHVSYLTFHSRTGDVQLSGREVADISLTAEHSLARELARPEYRRLRAELQLPAPGTTFYTSQVSWLASDGETHHVQGQDVYLFDLALTIWYQQQPAAGILCWLYDQALGHGWIAVADQQAFAAEIQAALGAGVARAGMGWDGICSLLHSDPGNVVTSLPSVGNDFPDAQLALRAGTWPPGLPNPGDPDELDALWDQLGRAEQWELCMQALRGQPARQWRPGGGYVFGDFTLKPETGLVRAAELAS